MIPTFEEAIQEAVREANKAAARADNKFDAQANALTSVAWSRIAALLKQDDNPRLNLVHACDDGYCPDNGKPV